MGYDTLLQLLVRWKGRQEKFFFFYFIILDIICLFSFVADLIIIHTRVLLTSVGFQKEEGMRKGKRKRNNGYYVH